MEPVKRSRTKTISPRQALDQHLVVDGIKSCRKIEQAEQCIKLVTTSISSPSILKLSQSAVIIIFVFFMLKYRPASRFYFSSFLSVLSDPLIPVPYIVKVRLGCVPGLFYFALKHLVGFQVKLNVTLL